ncbi:MAG: hypothetical protein IJY25_05250 [Bacilli bacterium]|nr:hypothetical protein [Bacilli bacterium]
MLTSDQLNKIKKLQEKQKKYEQEINDKNELIRRYCDKTREIRKQINECSMKLREAEISLKDGFTVSNKKVDDGELEKIRDDLDEIYKKISKIEDKAISKLEESIDLIFKKIDSIIQEINNIIKEGVG